MTPRTALVLGRVSNLPTVFTNVAAGAALAGVGLPAGTLVALALAMSCFYVGGMYLNDAFDREIDARERPERPIPSGRVRAQTVFAIGGGLLVLGIIALAAIGSMGGAALPGALAGVALAGTIVIYDVAHKGNPSAPIVMGACRAGVYVCVVASVAGLDALDLRLALAGGALALYVAGLTYVAAQETLTRVASWWPIALLMAPAALALCGQFAEPGVIAVLVAHAAWTALALRHIAAGRIGAGVVRLIAGICWVDALFVLTYAEPDVTPIGVTVVACMACLALTRFLQARIPGT